MSYEYTLPTTGAFFYSSCIREDGGIILETASQHRAQLRDVLKRLKRSNHKDVASVIKTIEDYKPYLAQIYSTLKSTDAGNDASKALELVKPIVTSWRATFHDARIPGKAPARIDVHGIEAEVTFVLLTYAYALSTFAAMASHDPQRIVQLYCQAAGVFHHIQTQVAPGRREHGKTCPELYPELSTCLEKLTLGEAQLAAMRQIGGKASNSVLCRIAVGASDQVSSAIGLLGSHPMVKSIPSEFRQHLGKRRDFALSRAYYYFALEQEHAGEVGFALACAQFAEHLYKDEDTTTALRVLMKQNSQVTFQPVPSRDEVQAKLPSGRDFVRATPFEFEPQHSQRRNQQNGDDRYAGSGAYY